MGPEAQGKGSIMKKVTRITAALIVCMALGVTTAAAAPRGNGEGHAYAWGLYKDRGKVEVVEPAPVGPVEAPAFESPVVEDFEDVLVYSGALSSSPDGFWVKLYKTVQSGPLGYARPLSASGITDHFLGEELKFHEYRITFDAAGAAPTTPSWNSPISRITYAYEGFTTVTVDGVSHRMGTPEAAAALATDGLVWSATYREMWSSNGYHTPTSFNGWVVLDYSAVR